MKYKSFLLGIALVIYLISFGCAAVNHVDPENAALEKQQEIAMGESLIKAFQKRDIKLFYSNLTVEGRQVWGTKEFEFECRNIRERWGEIDSFRYLTQLEMEPTHQYVWAVKFKRNSSPGGKPVYQDVLFVILTGKIDGKAKVFLFGFK